MSEDLSGDWIGNYSYPGELEPVPFLATLVESNGNLTGETTEPGHTPEMGTIAHALVQGQHQGPQVHFTKMYDTIDDDPILYEGTVDETATEIHGSWTIAGKWSGSFVMSRTAAAEERVDTEEEVSV